MYLIEGKTVCALLEYGCLQIRHPRHLLADYIIFQQEQGRQHFMSECQGG